MQSFGTGTLYLGFLHVHGLEKVWLIQMLNPFPVRILLEKHYTVLLCTARHAIRVVCRYGHFMDISTC
jgi:hypothetical protein